MAVAGITLGLCAWLLVTLFGLTETPLHSAVGLNLLRWAGIAYLIWLAWETMRAPTSAAPAPAALNSPFVRGLVSNLLNPKAAIFYLALLPGFIRPSAGPVAPRSCSSASATS